MKKIIICLLVLLFFIGCSYYYNFNQVNQKQTNSVSKNEITSSNDDTTTAPTVTPTITQQIIKNIDIDDNKLLSNLYELCKTQRRFNTEGEKRALNFLIDKMTEYGYQTYTQEFFVYPKNSVDMD